MSNKSFEPEKLRVLSEPQAIGAYANPARMAILAILAEDPATLSMVASRLGAAPANLSHHFRKLLAAGLILLVETRTGSRNVEKLYRAVARAFIVDPGGLGSGDRGVLALSLLREELSGAIARARSAPEKAAADRSEILVLLSTARIAGSRADALREKLEGLVAEFQAGSAAASGTEGRAFTLGMALFPAGPEDVGRGELRLGEGGQDAK